MRTNNPLMDTLVESQTQFVNNWMESAKKMQAAFTDGTMSSEGQSFYRDFFEKQMAIFNGIKNMGSTGFGQDHAANNPQDFFKNWFNQQAVYAKQMEDFNQSINNSFMNFGKAAQNEMNNFGQTNNAFSTIYKSWLSTLNTSYDAMSRTMNGTFNKDVFSTFMQGNQMYMKMQEFFAPMQSAMQKGQFSMDAFKSHFTPDLYNQMSRQMFGTLYDQNSMKAMYDNAIDQLQNFFSTQNNLSKEYVQQMQKMSSEFPNLFGKQAGTDTMKEANHQMQNMFALTFEPLMKLVTGGKEKDAAEDLIKLMDKMAQYSIKQAELQSLLQDTTRKSLEALAREYADKYTTPEAIATMPSPQEMYNEWIKLNEQLFSELFATDAFSRVKGEALNLTNELKLQFEKQFENNLSMYPFVFKSEVSELEKTVYDLKKQVKELQAKLANSEAPAHEAAQDTKNAKNRKK
jgi:class III poly(R)-hydroxyalkanoic acid synthase PhaE subunit